MENKTSNYINLSQRYSINLSEYKPFWVYFYIKSKVKRVFLYLIAKKEKKILFYNPNLDLFFSTQISNIYDLKAVV